MVALGAEEMARKAAQITNYMASGWVPGPIILHMFLSFSVVSFIICRMYKLTLSDKSLCN